jgi:hypothetical protein
MPDEPDIGTIVRLQVQRSPLKVGERPHRHYDPGPLLEVQHLHVTPRGCVGWLPDDAAVLDVHHVDHPASRSRDGGRGLSIGFTSHYHAMRGRFGERVEDGLAGENVVVASEHVHTLDGLGSGIGVVSATTGETVWLSDVGIARPCKAFSRYCLGHEETSAQELRGVLEFLDGGTRGFYASLADPSSPVVLRPGDRIIARPR